MVQTNPFCHLLLQDAASRLIGDSPLFSFCTSNIAERRLNTDIATSSTPLAWMLLTDSPNLCTCELQASEAVVFIIYSCFKENGSCHVRGAVAGFMAFVKTISDQPKPAKGLLNHGKTNFGFVSDEGGLRKEGWRISKGIPLWYLHILLILISLLPSPKTTVLMLACPIA